MRSFIGICRKLREICDVHLPIITGENACLKAFLPKNWYVCVPYFHDFVKGSQQTTHIYYTRHEDLIHEKHEELLILQDDVEKIHCEGIGISRHVTSCCSLSIVAVGDTFILNAPPEDSLSSTTTRILQNKTFFTTFIIIRMLLVGCTRYITSINLCSFHNPNLCGKTN